MPATTASNVPVAAAAEASATSTVPARPGKAVRVMHTSDWHLGVTVRSHPRSDDHDAVIAEIIGLAAAAQPDLIIHTGDLFDGHRPAMSEFGRAIKALRALAEIAPVAILAGNHDSAVAMEVLGVALGDTQPDEVACGSYNPHTVCSQRIRVHARPGTAGKGAVSTYQTQAGGKLRLVALPFVHANRVLVDFDQLVEANATYNDSLRKIVAALAKTCFEQFDTGGDVAVFASHLHIKDARTSTEKTIHIAEDYATDPAHLDGRFAYLAFGHIHVPQAIAGGRGQYAGSILEVNFGEEGERKRVVVADMIPGRPTTIISIDLTAGRRLRAVRVPLSQLADHADDIGADIVEVTIIPEPSPPTPDDTMPGTARSVVPRPFRRDDMVIVGDLTFDTLSIAVANLLPDATVVSVVDARNPYVVVADEFDAPTGPAETVNDSFRAWLASDADAIVTRSGAGIAAPERVATMFDECHSATVSGADIELAEITALTALVAEN